MRESWSRPSVAGACPSARCAHAADVVDTRLFVFGGWDGRTILNDLYVLDTGSFFFFLFFCCRVVSREKKDPTRTSVCPHDLFSVCTRPLTLDGKARCVGKSSKSKETSRRIVPVTRSTRSAPRSFFSAEATATTISTTYTLSTLVRLPLSFIFLSAHTFFFFFSLTVQKESGLWKEEKVSGTLPPARSRHSSTLIGETLYVMGGGDNSHVYGDVFALDTRSC